MATFLRIHDAVIQSYLLGGGEVKEEMDEVVKWAAIFAAGRVNKRTGKLAANFNKSYTKVTGPLIGSANFSNSVKYAGWVNAGTNRITAPGKFLVVPRTRGVLSGSVLAAGHVKGSGPAPFVRLKSVAGQRPQRFMEKGLRDALDRQGLF